MSPRLLPLLASLLLVAAGNGHAAPVTLSGLLLASTEGQPRGVARLTLLAEDGRRYQVTDDSKLKQHQGLAQLAGFVVRLKGDANTKAKTFAVRSYRIARTHVLRGTLRLMRASTSLECYLAGGGDYLKLITGDVRLVPLGWNVDHPQFAKVAPQSRSGLVLVPTAHATARALAAFDGQRVEVVTAPHAGRPWTRPADPASYPTGLTDTSMIGAGFAVYSVRAVASPHRGEIVCLQGSVSFQHPPRARLLGPPSGMAMPNFQRKGWDLLPSPAVKSLQPWQGKYVRIRAIPTARGYVVVAIRRATAPPAPPGMGR